MSKTGTARESNTMNNRPPTPSPMPAPTSNVGMDNITQGHLDDLKTDIDRIQADANAGRRAYIACWCRILVNGLGLMYLITARILRARAAPFIGFGWALIALGTTLAWAVFTVVSLSLLVGVCGAFFGAVLFSCLIYLPNNDKLLSGIPSREERGKELTTQRTRLREFLRRAKTNLVGLQQRYSQWEAWLQERLHRESIQRRRQELATSDWKSLEGNMFQHFLAEVFRLLDYEVKETGQAGDHGVDLIVKRHGNRIAIQIKGYPSGNSVDNKAVQEAYSGKDIWNCHACAVITNSRYTKQAIEDAARLGCVMIDELTLRALIVGQRDLWQECMAARPVGAQPLPNQRR